MQRGLIGALIAVIAGCSAPARDFGYSRTYVTTHEEARELSTCRLGVTPATVCGDFTRWHGERVSWFGVITQLDGARNGAEEGWVVLRLSHRPHIEHHRCGDDTDASCRVTVDVREDGVFSTRVQLRPDDWTGPMRVRVGSLLRVVGTLSLDACRGEDGPFIDATWYRHWPHGFYATTSGGDHPAGE